MTREQHLQDTLEYVVANLSVLYRNPTAIDATLRNEILGALESVCKGAIARTNYDEVAA
jgi:hypothetical protein